MAISGPFLILGGILSVLGLGTAAVVLSDRPGADLGGTNPSEIRGSTPNPANDSMRPVGTAEADKRAVVNRAQADQRASASKGFVAAPVIAETRPPEQDMPEAAPVAAKPPEPAQAPPPPVVIHAPAPPPQIVYVEVPQQPTANPDQVTAINEQIKSLLKPTPGGFTVRSYAMGERPRPPAPAQTGPRVDGPFGPGYRHAMVARTGDVAYAVLDRGFNSDDPAAPVFATITDLDERGRPGPLHDIRLMGQIVYTPTQASIRFSSVILQNGQQAPMQALAITVDQARNGVAEDVDNHVLQRYGSLVFAGLLQGVGQVAQQLTQQNTTTTITEGFAVQSGNRINYPLAAVGAAAPVGQALTAVAARNFAQPPTLGSPTNMPIGIVFLQPLVLPISTGPQGLARAR